MRMNEPVEAPSGMPDDLVSDREAATLLLAFVGSVSLILGAAAFVL